MHRARHAAHGAGDLRPVRPAGGRRRGPRGCASRRRRRGAPSRAASRSGGRAPRGRASAWRRRATRIGPRSCRATPVRRRTDRASDRFASRRCHGHAPDPGSGRRAPSTRSASPATHGCGDPVEVGADERPVAVHERDEVLGRREQAGVTGGAEAASRLDDHDRTELARRRRPSRRSSRCRRRSACQPSGMPASTPGMARASSSTGRITLPTCALRRALASRG